MYGSMRQFDVKIFDGNQKEVMQFNHPLSCDSDYCFPCCLQSLVVSTPLGRVIGSIEEEWTFCYPNYSVKNHNGDTVMRIKGPICKFSCGSDIIFKASIRFLLLKTIDLPWSVELAHFELELKR